MLFFPVTRWLARPVVPGRSALCRAVPGGFEARLFNRRGHARVAGFLAVVAGVLLPLSVATAQSPGTDTTGPVAVSAETSRDGSQVTFTFDEAIRSDPAPDQGVVLIVDNATASLGSGAYVVEGQTVTVTPRTPVTVGQRIRAMVLGSGGGERIRDLSGNVVQTITNLPVTNDVVDIRATLLLTPDEIVENGGESVVTATLSEASTADTTVTVSVAPDAGAAAGDVTLSANRVLTVAAGATTSTGTVTMTANDNSVAASAKTFTVSGTVANADEDVAAPDDVRLTIDDDDGGICGRTRQVREAILARLDGVTRCADVTDAHLAGITGTLNLRSTNIGSLRAGDFAGLSAVRLLDLYGNALTTLPSGVLTGLSDLATLYLDNNALTALPADLLAAVPELGEFWARNNALTEFPRGFFAGKREVGEIQVYHNPGAPDLRALDPVASHRGDPLGVYYGLEALGPGRFKIVVPVGTAFETAVSLSVTNGTLDSDRVVMPAGRLESNVLTVTRTPGTSAPVTVDIVDLRSPDPDRRPGDYSRKLTSMSHNGIVPAKSGDLPLEVFAAVEAALASAVVNGDVLTLTYEEALDEESVPAASAYSVSVGGVAQTPSAVTVSGSAVTVTLSAQAYVGQAVTVSYTAPASNPVQSAAGSDVDTLTAYAVTNETPNTAPTIDTAAALDVAENERTVVTLRATDPDPDATQTWSLTGGADRSHFTLSENVLAFTAEKDFERPDDTGNDGGYEVTVTVVDDRGAEASKAVTVTLTDVVTEAPTASDGEVETDEDTPYSFAAGDFNFAGTDADDALASVTIVTGPSAGSLELDGAAVTADRVVTTAQLDNGDLVFTPAANAHGSGYATFTFKVSDGEAESADAYTMTVDVTAVNDAATGAPTISGTTMVGQTLTASTAGIADADGLTGVSYSYQWIRVDSGNKDNPRTIAGATSSRYTLTRDDQYENVMVRVSFTDDDRHDEALTSAASTRVRASLSSIPASADMLVSNLGQIQDGVRGRFRSIDMAQRFTTGSNAGGYTLRSVDLQIYTDHISGTIPPTVKIFSGSADGAEVATLRGPAALEANIEKTYAFTASGTVTLNPSTDYWVVAEGGAARWLGTASDSEDAASASGWSIRDVSEYRDASSTDSFLDAAYNATRIRINGAANGLVFSRTQVAVDEGGTAGYTVQLDARPSASVTVSLASGDANAATVSPGSLTFTTSDWNIAQTVTVTGVEDDDGDHESVTLTHSAAGFVPRTVTAAVNDDDDDVAPAADSATVTGASLVIAFDDDLAAAPDLANGAFTVKKTPSGGTERTETLTGSPSIDGRTVTLTLGSVAVSTDTGVTVSYTQPATGNGNRLADGNGNEVADFTLAATNDTPDCPAGQPADAFATACLTVAEVNFGYGYSLSGGSIISASGAKTWNFTRNGKSYEISEIKTVWSGLSKAGLNVVFGANPPPASESWILQVGSRSFRFDARTRYILFSNVPGHRYVWASPGFTWDAGNHGDRVSVSLRQGPPGPDWPLKTEMTGSVPEADEGTSAQGCRVDVDVRFLDADGEAVAVDALAASDFTVENGRAGTPVADADGLGWTVPVQATDERGLLRVRLPATARWAAAEQVFHNRGAGGCVPAARGELASLWVDDLSISPSFTSATTSYTSGTTDADAVVLAETVYDDATVTVTPEDADEEADGHQVAFAEGETEIAVTVTPGDGSAARTYTVTVTREPAPDVLMGFVLVDAVTGADLGPITAGGTVTVSAVGIYGIRAGVEADAAVGSVVLTLSNPVAKSEEHRQTENVAPYSLFGDAEGAEHGRALAAGSYTLTAMAYEHPHGAGKVLGTLRVPFKVAIEAGTESSPGVLTGFVLLDASDQSTVAALTDGAAIDLGGRSGGAFAIRANVASNARVGSVALSLSGAKTVSATENLAPYSLYGDDMQGTLHGGTLPAGTYTLSATAYAARRASGATLGTRSVSFEVLAPAALSVADARAEEGTDAALDFAVTLDRSSTGTVTVAYATVDGTATAAGDDYTATAGTLTFQPGEREKTVSVPVLDDTHDEGAETLTLRLTSPTGATIADGEAIGTITNSDPLQRAWLARFGRTVGTHVTDAVGERLRGAGQASHLTIGGYRLPLGRQPADQRRSPNGSGPAPQSLSPGGREPAPDSSSPPLPTVGEGRGEGTEAERALAAKLWSPLSTDAAAAPPGRLAAVLTEVARVLGMGPGGASSDPGNASHDAPWLNQPGQDPRLGRSMTPTFNPDLRQVLLGSSFRLNLGATDAGAGTPRLTAWGRFAGTTFAGQDGDLALDGDVFTGTVGVDSEWDRLLAGVAVAHSRGDGSFNNATPGMADRGRGGLEQTLTSLHPYLRYAVTDRLDVWGVVGYGWGELDMEMDTGVTLETDTNLVMGAFGGRGILLAAADTGGFQLATRTDAMLTRTSSDAVTGGAGNLAAADADAHRVRVILEGSRGVTWDGGQSLTPTVEVGLRHDWGDAETGFGVEVGGRVQYADPGLGLTVEGAVRGLLAHEDSDYQEWGASGTVRLAPGVGGQGLSLTLAPTWGAAASGVEGLWSRQTTQGLAPQGLRPTQTGRLQAEVGYGLPAPLGTGLLTPYAGTMLAEGADRTYRVGTRWAGVTGLTLNLEGTRQESAGQQPVNQGVRLQVQWGF